MINIFSGQSSHFFTLSFKEFKGIVHVTVKTPHLFCITKNEINTILLEIENYANGISEAIPMLLDISNCVFITPDALSILENYRTDLTCDKIVAIATLLPESISD